MKGTRAPSKAPESARKRRTRFSYARTAYGQVTWNAPTARSVRSAGKVPSVFQEAAQVAPVDRVVPAARAARLEWEASAGQVASLVSRMASLVVTQKSSTSTVVGTQTHTAIPSIIRVRASSNLSAHGASGRGGCACTSGTYRVPPQNPVDRTIVDVSTLGVNQILVKPETVIGSHRKGFTLY